MIKDEALRLALEALEEIHRGNMTPMAEESWNKAITAIKAALEAKDEPERCTPNCEALLQKLVTQRRPLTQKQLDVILGAHDLNMVVGKDRWQIIAAMRNIESAHGIKGQE